MMHAWGGMSTRNAVDESAIGVPEEVAEGGQRFDEVDCPCLAAMHRRAEGPEEAGKLRGVEARAPQEGGQAGHEMRARGGQGTTHAIEEVCVEGRGSQTNGL